MANNSKRYTREFSYARPIMYQGEAYPSADSMISDEYGNKIKGTIFADTFGNYYTKDRSNNVFPVMPVENLDEITVTAPRNIDMLADAFSRSLVMGNDRTQVRNLPHRQYNTQLKANAERGAREHALWDKENPNLSAWRDAATAVPLAVAATPIVLGAGQGILGTTVGQVARQGIATLMSNPYVAGVNDAIGLGFAGKGAYDVTQGKFTPETALDFMGLYPVARSLTGLSSPKTKLSSNLVGNSNSNPFINEDIVFNYKQDPLEMHYQRAKAKGYSPNRIEYYNLTEDSERNTQLIQKLAKDWSTTPEVLLSDLKKHLNTRSGHAAALTDRRNTIIHDGKLPKSHASAILSHEVDHALHIPDEPVPDGVLFSRIYLRGNYFKNFNNTEVAARGSQLHDYFGHTGTEPITADELRYAKEHYVKDTGINNNMYDFLWSINDYDALAKWMTKYSTGIIPFGLGTSLYNSNQTK